ncbi:hypothetical protein HOI83_03785 [Candidatus Uhrbacteria bacterium]|jgi:hypothetical protein|nr:hypothetical protein [Candidatus Uhrbacteria bacterium]
MSRTTAFRLLRDIGVKRTAIAVLIFMFILSTFMMVSPFFVSAAAPVFTMGGWKDGQDIIVVSFDDQVHDGQGGPLVAADFTVAGANSISISSVDHGPGDMDAIITLSGNLNSAGGTDFTITCATGEVLNGDMEACTSSPVNVYTAIAEDTTGPAVQDIARIDINNVFVAFDEPVDENSFGPGSVVLATSDGGDDSTITDIAGFGSDAIGVEATGAVIAEGSGNTVQVTTSVTDLFGNASAGETVTILPSIKISEFRVSSLSSDTDEFVELYNYGPTPVDMTGVKLHFWDGSTDTNVAMTMFNTQIPPNGFFLIAPSNFIAGDGDEVADASYSASAAELVSNGAVYISYSATADTDVIDLVGWGTSTKKEGTALADITGGQNLERLAVAGADANSMTGQGGDVFDGNGSDSQDNSIDFVIQATAVPQNSFSLPEFAGGAAFNENGDQTPPTVTDSFPDAASAAFIPQEFASAGLSFSEQMDPGTIDTTSVLLVVDTDQGTNLCQSISYDPAATFGAQVTCNIDPSALPLASVPHTFAATMGVTDFSGNGLASDYTVGFTPSSAFSFSSQAIPEMVGAYPGPNTSSYPPNSGFININFNQELDSSTLAGNVTLVNTTQSTSETITGMQLLSIVDPNDAIELDVSGVSFTAGEDYLVTITTGVTSSDGVALAADVQIPFTVADSNDNTAPIVIASNPSDGATGVDVGMPIVFISIDDALDASTVTTSSVALYEGFAAIPATVSYNSNFREIEIFSEVVFQPSTEYTVVIGGAGAGAAVSNVSGTELADTDGYGPADTTHNIKFTTGAADVTAPTASFASATQNKIDVTFAEGMLGSSIENLANWSLESPVGSSVPLSAMAGIDASWDPSTMTASLGGISLTDGASFEITAGVGIKDMAANPLGSPAVLGGTVLDVAIYGSSGPGAGFTGNEWDLPAAFDDGTFGFVPQAGVWPMNGMAGMVSSYNVDFPISEQIRANGNGGKVVMTFPTGFDVTGASFDSTNPMNSDSNGPGVGIFAVNSVTANAAARTVTVDFTGATRCGAGNTDPCVSDDEQDFIGMSISGIVNSSVPRDWETAGYTVDIKTMTSGTLLETMTSMPFFINAAGANSLAVTVTAGSQNSGGFDVHISSPTTGEMTQTLDFSNNLNGTEVATFTGLPEDYYDVWTEPLVLSDAYQGIMSEQAWVTGSATGSYTLTGTSGFQLVTINVSGTTGKDIDVIASGSRGFQVQRIQNTSGSDQVTMNLPDGDWNFDIGPHMDMSGGFTMPEPPDYKVTPRWLPVNVANPNVTEDSDTADDGTLEFVLSAAAFTVPVSVVDTSGNPIVDAMVFMDDTTAGFGTFGQTATTGIASLGIDAGTYRVGAFMQGAPPTGEITVKVAGNGDIFQDGSDVATLTVVLELSKSDTVISGTVTDGTSAVGGAGVHAFCTANCEGYFDAGTMSDTNGGYTLYVGNGTWNVEAFIPGYGPTGQTTVAVSNADQTGINLEPDTNATFRIISGTVCKKDGGAGDCSSGSNLEGLAGIEVFAYSQAAGGGSNFTQTASDGTYSLRVPGTTGYTVEAWDHRAGPLPMLSSVDTSSGNATTQDIVIGTPLGVTVNIEDGASGAVVLEEMYIELFDDSTGIRQNLFIENDSSGSIDLPPGDYDMFVHTMSAPIDPATDVAGAGGTVVSTGVLTVDSAETVTVVVPALNTVTGQLTDGANPVADAWVEVSDPTLGIFMGTTTDSSGNYSIEAPVGSYQVNAYSPGLVLDAVTLAVTGAETLNLAGSTADQTISGTVTDLNGNAVPYAFIEGIEDSGRRTAVQADADGEYELAVDDGDWSLTANGYGYQPEMVASSVGISGAPATSQNIQFTAVEAGLSDPTVTTLTPSEGGMASDATLGLSVTVPSNATGTSTSAGSLTMKETNNVVDTATTSVVGNGFEVSMVDNGGTQLTSGFTEPVSIGKTMTVAELNTAGITLATEVDGLTMSYYDGGNGTWVPETTTTVFLDGSGNVVASPASNLSDVTSVRFSTAVDHFTVFSITAPSDGVAPAAPAGVAAVGATSGNTVSWTAVTTNSDASAISDLVGYELYRDTSSGGSYSTQVNGSDILTTSYEDTTATAGTLYYYKVTASDTGGLESSKSSAVSATRTTASSGGGGGSAPRVWSDQGTDDTDEVVADDASPELISEVQPDAVSDEADTVLGITRDSEGRRVAPASGVEGASPLDGSLEPVSTVSAGQFVRSYAFDTVYYVDEDMKRRPFWDARSFFTWGTDWDDIVWVTDATLSTMSLSVPMLPQPGHVLVKIESDPKVYAIEADPTDPAKDILRWIPSEAVANNIYGSAWADYIIDIEPTVYIRYTTGLDIALGESVDTSGIQTRVQISAN